MIIYYIYIFIIAFLACLIGLILDRYILLKFFLCYETLFFTISVIMLILSINLFNIYIITFIIMFGLIIVSLIDTDKILWLIVDPNNYT